MACKQCQLPVCVQCMEISEHKNHDFTSVNGLLREKKAELDKTLNLCYLKKNQLLSRRKKLEAEVDKMQFIMISKYRTLKHLLDEYLLQNHKKIRSFLESQTDDIYNKLDDIDRYISNVMKNLNKMSEKLPAQALIQLQSCSLIEDLFKTHSIVYPDIGIKETDLMNAINLFGNIPVSIGAKGSTAEMKEEK